MLQNTVVFQRATPVFTTVKITQLCCVVLLKSTCLSQIIVSLRFHTKCLYTLLYVICMCINLNQSLCFDTNPSTVIFFDTNVPPVIKDSNIRISYTGIRRRNSAIGTLRNDEVNQQNLTLFFNGTTNLIYTRHIVSVVLY